MKTPPSGGRPPARSKNPGAPTQGGNRPQGTGRPQGAGRPAGTRPAASGSGKPAYAGGKAAHGTAKPAHAGRARPDAADAKPHTPRIDHGGTLRGPRDAAPEAAAPRAPAAPKQRFSTTPVPPRPQNPAGTIFLYGLHPVVAALANPSRRLRRLLLTEEAEANLAEHLRPPYSVQPERIDRARLDHLLGHDAVHQGIALLADPLPQPSLQQVLERPGPMLVLDQVTDPRNIGAILRSAAAFGIAGVITQDRNAPEETGALAKAASGALETVPLIRAVNLARTLVALKAAGLWIVGLAADAPALRGTAMMGRRIALVLGAEGPGMRRLTRETCDELAGLTMPGSMESLNVSAAAAVALYELTRG